MSMLDSLLDPVILTIVVLLTMAIISCLCCVSIKLSDMKLKKCIVEMSQRKGVPVDIEKLELKQVYTPPNPDDACAIVVPDLGIVVACINISERENLALRYAACHGSRIVRPTLEVCKLTKKDMETKPPLAPHCLCLWNKQVYHSKR